MLYPQFTSVDAVLLDAPAEDAAPAGAGGGAAEPKPKRQKVKRKQEEGAGGDKGNAGGDAAAAAPDAAAAADADAPPKRKQRGKRAKKPAVQPSGPGNAEEAASMRAALGFDGGAVAPVAAAPGGTAVPAAGTFSFGFAVAADDATGVPLDGATPAGALPPPPPPTTAAAAANGGVAPATRERRPRGGRAAATSTSTASLARRVFVGGMPFAYEEEDVREYWEWCGPIASLDLMRFPDTGRFRGIAFLTFATDEGYTKALECDGTMLDGVRVKVEPCKTAKRGAPDAHGPAARAQGPAPKTPGYNVAYVGNIAFEATVDDLASLFEGVTRVRLHTDKLTGRSKGYAHIHFRDGDAVDAAVAQDGVELMGRGVKVSYGQPKKEEGGGVGVAEA